MAAPQSEILKWDYKWIRSRIAAATLTSKSLTSTHSEPTRLSEKRYFPTATSRNDAFWSSDDHSRFNDQARANDDPPSEDGNRIGVDSRPNTYSHPDAETAPCAHSRSDARTLALTATRSPMPTPLRRVTPSSLQARLRSCRRVPPCSSLHGFLSL